MPNNWQEQLHYLPLQLAAENIKQGDRQIEVSVTEETLARRWFGNIILGHRPGECRLQRIMTVGSFLFAHGRDPNYGVVPVGPVLDVWLDEKARKYRARLQFDQDEKAEILYQKVLSAALRGISVGVRFYKVLEVAADAEERGFKGPFYLVTDWDIDEISLEPTPELVVGVGLSSNGPDAEGALAGAPGSEINDEREGNSMKYKVQRNGVEVEVDEAQLTAEERIQFGLDKPSASPASPAPAPAAAGGAQPTAQEVLATERLRVKQINTICSRFSLEEKDRQGFIDDGLTVAQVNEKVLEKLAADPRRGAIPTAAVLLDERDKFRAAAADGISLKADLKVEKPAVGADSFRGMRLLTLAQLCAERVAGRDMRLAGEQEILRAALGFGEHGQFMGASDFPLILADVANKAMMSGYEAAGTTYQIWTRRGSLADFKTAHRLTLSHAPDLEEIKQSGEFVIGEFSEAEQTIALKTYGKRWGLGRQAIINDDLDAFSKMPMLYAVAARRLVNATVYGFLTANATFGTAALFHGDHDNLGAGALTVAALAACRGAMAIQTDISGKQILNIQPAYLLVPAAKEAIASQLIGSSVDPAKANAAMNPFFNKLAVVGEPTLDASSTTVWYAVGAPGITDTIEVAFLNGNDNPTIESKAEFDTLGMSFRIYLDFGAAILDYRAMYKSSGS